MTTYTQYAKNSFFAIMPSQISVLLDEPNKQSQKAKQSAAFEIIAAGVAAIAIPAFAYKSPIALTPTVALIGAAFAPSAAKLAVGLTMVGAGVKAAALGRVDIAKNLGLAALGLAIMSTLASKSFTGFWNWSATWIPPYPVEDKPAQK